MIHRNKRTDSIDVSVAKWLVNFKFIVNATGRNQLTALEKARFVVTTDTPAKNTDDCYFSNGTPIGEIASSAISPMAHHWRNSIVSVLRRCNFFPKYFENSVYNKEIVPPHPPTPPNPPPPSFFFFFLSFFFSLSLSLLSSFELN